MNRNMSTTTYNTHNHTDDPILNTKQPINISINETEFEKNNLLYQRQIKIEQDQINDAILSYTESMSDVWQLSRASGTKSIHKYILEWYKPLLDAIQNDIINLTKDDNLYTRKVNYYIFYYIIIYFMLPYIAIYSHTLSYIAIYSHYSYYYYIGISTIFIISTS
jgi:hypothetical protein